MKKFIQISTGERERDQNEFCTACYGQRDRGVLSYDILVDTNLPKE